MKQQAPPRTGPAPATVPAGPSSAGPGRAVGVIAPAVILVIGMVAAVNLAIPKLQASGLHPSVSATAWVVDSYTLLLAVALLAAFALYELRRPYPMLDPRLFRLAGVRAGSLGIVALFFALFGCSTSTPSTCRTPRATHPWSPGWPSSRWRWSARAWAWPCRRCQG
jgi:hypothetical protein